MDPLQQFKVHTLIPLHLFGWDVSFTNASLFMCLSTFFIIGWLLVGMPGKKIIPNRLQMVNELLYAFIGDVLKSTVGEKGRDYFPFVFSLFLFVLTGNLIGLFPFSFTFTSQIVVTLAMASMVFVGVTLIGFIKHGFGFLRLFCPKGTPLFIAPLLVPVELMSYLSRPFSLGVRLFANMVAGHAMLKIFAGFAALLATSSLMPLSVLPFVVTVLVMGFEVLVAVLQAYIFTILTCIYLNDAINLH